MARPTKKEIPTSASFVYNDTSDRWEALTEDVIKAVAGLVILPYDYVSLSYVSSGNGSGEIQTAIFKSGGASGTTVATVTMTYNSDNEIVTITKT